MRSGETARIRSRPGPHVTEAYHPDEKRSNLKAPQGDRARAVKERTTVLPTALTIAGSDSSGGAGIQADLKAMLALGVHGASAVTAVTAQSTAGVRSSLVLPPELVAAQIDAVLEDLVPGATKTGMLAAAGVMEAVADRIDAHGLAHVVVDPVMVATSGGLLIEEDAVAVMRDLILPLAEVVTPNIPELETLAGVEVVTQTDAADAASRLLDLGAANVLVKGGHLEGPATDVLYGEGDPVRFEVERVGAGTLHGTGCTFSSAVAARLAHGDAVEDAVARAKEFVTGAIRGSFRVGGGGSLLDPTASGDPRDERRGGKK
jgi:hydroxymethylpyrimidine/phosphomethylpyrimidine kinase